MYLVFPSGLLLNVVAETCTLCGVVMHDYGVDCVSHPRQKLNLSEAVILRVQYLRRAMMPRPINTGSYLLSVWPAS